MPLPVAPADRDVAVRLAALSLHRIAPEELVFLDETAADFFADPSSVLPDDDDGEAVGAGIDLTFLTPYLLWMASVVLPLLGAFAADIARDVGKDLIKDPLVDGIRSLVKRTPDEPPGPVALTWEQRGQVRQAVVESSRRLRLSSDTAALLADATVGSLHVRP